MVGRDFFDSDVMDEGFRFFYFVFVVFPFKCRVRDFLDV